MTRFLEKIADIRAGERRLTLVMGSYYFVLLISYYLLKPARDSLFLTELGAEQLPLAFILIALVAHPVSQVHGWAARKMGIGRLIGAASAVLAAILVGLYLLFSQSNPTDSPAAYYTLYVFVSLWGALTISQFWLLANRVYIASRARKMFVLLNVGAMLGAFAGGELANAVVTYTSLSTAHLLLAGAAVLAVSTAWVPAALKNEQGGHEVQTDEVQDESDTSDADPASRQNLSSAFATIRGNPFLLLIVAILGLEMFASTFVDFQFKTIATDALADERELTGFLATFYGRVSLIALAFQIFVLPQMLRRYGPRSAMLIMPAGLIAGSALILAAPILLTATILRGADQIFEHSADKVGRELLFLPLPMSTKKKVKVFIDVAIDRGFRGLAGATLLLLTGVLAFDMRMLSIVTLVVLVGWIVLVLKVHTLYAEAFAEAVDERRLEMNTTWTRTVSLDQALKAAEHALEDADDTRFLYALDAMARYDDDRIVQLIRPTLHHPSEVVRRCVLKVLRMQSTTSASADLVLKSEEYAGHAESVDHLLHDVDAGLRQLRDHSHVERDYPAENDTRCVLKVYAARDELLFGAADLREVAGNKDTRLRLTLALLLGAPATPRSQQDTVTVTFCSPSSKKGTAPHDPVEDGDTDMHDAVPTVVQETLMELSEDSDSVVRRAAIRSMGRLKTPEFVDRLIDSLGDDQVLAAAWTALTRYGTDILGPIDEAFEHPSTSEVVRRRIPRVVGEIPTQESADLLMSRLHCEDPVLRFNVSTALLRLRSQKPSVQLDTDMVEEALDTEIDTFYRLALTQHAIWKHSGDTSEHLRPLANLLDQHRDRSSERIFQLLGLRYCEHQFHEAYDAFSGDRDELRGLAVEWVDNVLDADLRLLLRPILDPPSLPVLAARAKKVLGPHHTAELDASLQFPFVQGVQLLLQSPIPRLQRQAIEVARRRLSDADDLPQSDRERTELAKIVLQRVDIMQEDADEAVRHAARRAVRAARGLLERRNVPESSVSGRPSTSA
ncbi:MAG: Npt1/Npt2 family nucleotide transporter [Rhodothermales bacterium]